MLFRSEVINDNEMGKQFYEIVDMVTTFKKETPKRISKVNDSHQIFKNYVEDEWDNIHGDLIHF